MRRVRSLACVVIALSALGAAMVAATAAAQAPVHLGQAATELNSGIFATGQGSCECTVAQYNVGSASPSYAIPFDGVLVASGFYIGKHEEPIETVQLQTVHRGAGLEGTVVSEGAAHSILGRTEKAVTGFYDRVPAHAGDVLAARFMTGHNANATPYYFKAAAGNEARISSSPRAAGESLEPAGSLAPERSINLEAVLEADEDHDGYGDTSQDLCPGSPIATSACSGSLLGSSLQGERTPSAECGGCTRVEKTVGGVSTAAPFDGVVVRWRVLTASFSGTYRARVVAPLGDIGGGFSQFKILRSSDPKSITTLGVSPLLSQISSFETRMPIAAGDYVGIAGGNQGEGFQSSTGAATFFKANEVGLDGNVVTGTTQNGTLLYDADIEPDVDGDGYGDVSQDSCPTSASIHEGICPLPPPPSGGGTGGGGATATPVVPRGKPINVKSTAPTISGLSLKPKRFFAKPLGPVAARGKSGTKIQLTLSAQATVAVAIEAKRGHRFKIVTKLTKSLAPGKRTIAFSGQYRHGGKLVDLAPGAYRLSASAKSTAGVGPVARTTFIVLPPA